MIQGVGSPVSSSSDTGNRFPWDIGGRLSRIVNAGNQLQGVGSDAEGRLFYIIQKLREENENLPRIAQTLRYTPNRSEPQGRTPLDIDLASARPRNDTEALARADSLLGGVNVHEIKSMERSLRNHYIALMRRGGLSVRQIARITGIGANIVARVQPEIADESNGS